MEWGHFLTLVAQSAIAALVTLVIVILFGVVIKGLDQLK